MTCQHAREILPELLDRRTAATGHVDVREHLAVCPDCQRELARLSETLTALDTMPTLPPSPRLRQNFYAMLEAEKRAAAGMRSSIERPSPGGLQTWWRLIVAPLAGAALLAVGFVAGLRYAPPSRDVAPDNSAANASALRKIDELEKKLNTMGQLVVATSLLQQQQRPTNDRLRGVLTSATSASEHPTEKVINELITALALDPSVNVRLRALDGLFAHADQEVVRAGVLASLPREENPIVQVSMIDFLAAARDAEARPELERIAVSNTAHANVRDAAKRALTHF